MAGIVPSSTETTLLLPEKSRLGRGSIMQSISRRSFVTSAAAAATATAFAPLEGRLPAHAAAPQIGRQAPGWYRLKLGDFEVTIVSDGMNSNPLTDAYVANQPKSAVNDALQADHLEKDKVNHGYTPLVINTGSKLVAIDVGLGLGLFAQSKGTVGQYHTNLQAAGIDRNTVDTVIISHFHSDHINGLIGPENKPAFPNAEIMVPAVEWAFWADESNVSKLPEVARGQMPNAKRVFGLLGNKVTQYEAGKELVSGITAVASYGHTPGHTSHVVASGNRKLLVQADITAGAASIFVRNPDWQLIFDADKAMAVESRKRLYDMAIAEGMLVHGYHFPFPALGTVEKAGSGYRLVPVQWNPNI
jgi:glyoxylase-like metal-dependent hydrolase (beta-lactamase superfamily II)